MEIESFGFFFAESYFQLEYIIILYYPKVPLRLFALKTMKPKMKTGPYLIPNFLIRDCRFIHPFVSLILSSLPFYVTLQKPSK